MFPFQNELGTIVERLAKQQELVKSEARAKDESVTARTDQPEGVERTKYIEQRQKPEDDRYEAKQERQSAKEKEEQRKYIQLSVLRPSFIVRKLRNGASS